VPRAPEVLARSTDGYSAELHRSVVETNTPVAGPSTACATGSSACGVGDRRAEIAGSAWSPPAPSRWSTWSHCP
jgi:hypothetical protein